MTFDFDRHIDRRGSDSLKWRACDGRDVIPMWTASHYGWQIDAEWIVWLPGLVPGLHVACLAYAAALEEVLTLVPVYPPFLAEHLPMFPVTRVEATYLAWPDTRWLGQLKHPVFAGHSHGGSGWGPYPTRCRQTA